MGAPCGHRMHHAQPGSMCCVALLTVEEVAPREGSPKSPWSSLGMRPDRWVSSHPSQEPAPLILFLQAQEGGAKTPSFVFPPRFSADNAFATARRHGELSEGSGQNTAQHPLPPRWPTTSAPQAFLRREAQRKSPARFLDWCQIRGKSGLKADEVGDEGAPPSPAQDVPSPGESQGDREEPEISKNLRSLVSLDTRHSPKTTAKLASSLINTTSRHVQQYESICCRGSKTNLLLDSYNNGRFPVFVLEKPPTGRLGSSIAQDKKHDM